MSMCNRQLRTRVLIGIALTTLALALRLWGAFDIPPQPDERHWTSRSAMFINRLNRGEWRDVTTHLPHPGLPESVAMGLSQELFQRVDNHYGLKIDDSHYVSRLDASRLAIVGLTSLIPAVIFFSFECLIGFWPALLGALILLLDPIHIGVSRWAHLDAALALFVLASGVVYLRALEGESIRLKLLAGLMWGLALASKPTAIALIPAFLLFRITYYWWLKQRSFFASIIEWSDIVTILVGHATFAALYTRFWNHPSDYPLRLGVKCKLAGELYLVGLNLAHSFGAIFGIGGLIAIALTMIYLVRLNKLSTFSLHVAIGALLTAFLLTTLALFPAVYENYAMYWTWVLGLSEIEHKHFNQGMIEVRPGYFNLLFTRTPIVLVIGLIVGSLVTVYRGLCYRIQKTAPLLLCLIASLVWLLALNTSGKQTWRYALPILPFLSILAASGWLAIANFIKHFRTDWQAERFICWAVVICLGFTSLPWLKYHEFFFNSLGSGLRAAIEAGHILPIRGHKEAIEYLLGQLPNFENRPKVTVLGDARTVEYTAELYFSKNATKLRFGDFQPWHADYLMLFTTAGVTPAPNMWAQTLATEPVFAFSWKGIELLRLYRVPPFRLRESIALKTTDFHLPNAELKQVTQQPERWLSMRPARQTPGFGFFYDGIALVPGEYKISTQYKLLPGPYQADVSEIGYLEFGPGCKRSVPPPAINADISDLSFTCRIDAQRDIFPRFYWNGSLGVALGPIRIENAQPTY